jgi:anti-anti-sigma factor
METKSEHVIVLGSLDKPDKIEQLDKFLKVIRNNNDRDVVVDLSDVTINSMVITKLLELRKIVKGAGRELILCGVDTHVKSVFTITGLDDVFHLAEDKSSAMNVLEEIRQGLGAETSGV